VPNPSNIQTILVSSNKGGLGDAIRERVFLSSLRQAFPNAEITYLTRKKNWHSNSMFDSLVRKPAMIHGKQYKRPLIDKIIIEKSLGRTLKELLFNSCPVKTKYDLIIAMERGLFPPLCVKKIPHTWFVSYSMFWIFSDLKPISKKLNETHILDKYYSIVEAASQKPAPEADFSLPVSSEDLNEAKLLLPDTKKKYIGQVPGAGDKSKSWALEKHIELASKLYDEGYIPVFILGPNETEWFDILQKEVPFAKFPLQETKQESSVFLTAAIGERLSAAVSNDCGTTHILASTEIPLITLFGRTSAEKNIPFSKNAITLSASDFVKGSKNMNDIPVDYVFNQLRN